jgi:hypothetical protein
LIKIAHRAQTGQVPVKSAIILHVFISLICILQGMDLSAQFRTSSFADLGQNVSSEGLFIKIADLTSYQLGKNKLEGGVQIDLLSNTYRFFSGFNFNFSREWSIKSFPIETRAFFILTPFSDILRESNWGILFGIYRDHFTIKIGTEFRTFAYNHHAENSYDVDKGTRIHENWNIMYSFSGYVKPIDNKWNIGLSLTNADHFIINQEINPFLNLRFDYKFNSTLQAYCETWYESAGALNLDVNYFGFFIRTGIIWDINLKD